MPDGSLQGPPDKIACALMDLLRASILGYHFRGANAHEMSHPLQQNLNVILSGYEPELRNAVAAELRAVIARDDLTVFRIVEGN